MELIQEKYIHTEVGLIPSDWKIMKLNEIVENGKIPSGIYKDKKLYGSGNKIIKLGDVFRFDFFKPELAQKVQLSQKEIESYKVQIGDIIIALASVKIEGVGKVMLVENLDEDTVYDHNVALIRIKDNYSNKYISYLFKSSIVRQFIASKATQVGTTFLKSSTILNLIFPLPSTIEEQTAIAIALSDVDNWIISLEQLITKKRMIKQGIMQDLLKAKEGWEVKKLGEVAEIYTGKKNNQDKVENGMYPFFVRSQTIEKINSYSFEGEAILIPGEGNIGKIFHYIDGKFDFHQRVYKISNFKDGYLGKYIYRYICEFFGRHAMENSVKATVDSLRLPTFQVFEIPFPQTIEEQTRIATILSDMDSEITTLESKLEKAKQLKLGMMQELLTGRIRLV